MVRGGDGGFLTPKAVAKRLKAKGLGKQWLYCQLCRKQCRDDNGFKCHCTSEQHIRKMELFEQNPELFVDDFSKRFEDKFMEYMKRSYYSTFVPPNVVYQQIIRERNHVRMNGTRWSTLHEFVEHLGKTGKCKVQETPKGVEIRYNDKDSEAMFKEGLKRKRADAEASLEDKHEREIELQIQRATEAANSFAKNSDGEPSSPEGETAEKSENAGVLPANPEVKVAFSLPPAKKRAIMAKDAGTSSEAGTGTKGGTWLFEGIVVKVLAKGGSYYKQKGVVKKVIEGSKPGAEIQMLDGGEKARFNQGELETVIPQIGRSVKVVGGQYRGCTAKLLSCDTAKFCVSIQIEKGPYDGTTVPGVAYEDICKLSS